MCPGTPVADDEVVLSMTIIGSDQRSCRRPTCCTLSLPLATGIVGSPHTPRLDPRRTHGTGAVGTGIPDAWTDLVGIGIPDPRPRLWNAKSRHRAKTRTRPCLAIARIHRARRLATYTVHDRHERAKQEQLPSPQRPSHDVGEHAAVCSCAAHNVVREC